MDHFATKVLAVYVLFFTIGVQCNPLEVGHISFHNVHNPEHQLDYRGIKSSGGAIGEAALHVTHIEEPVTKPNPFKLIDHPAHNGNNKNLPDHVREMKSSPHLIYSLHRNHENVPPPRSESRAINNKVTNFFSNANFRYPVATHAVNNFDNEVDHNNEHFVPLVPVAHRVLITNSKKEQELLDEHHHHHHIHHHVKPTHHPKSDLDESGEIPYRDTLGGLGIGFTYGGQGAGHGFFAG